MLRLVNIAESGGIIVEGTESKAKIAADTVYASIKTWTPREIDKAVTDAVKRFGVDRTELESHLERRIASA